MVLDVFDCWSLVTIIAEKSEDQVLELFRESVSVDFLEVCVILAFEKKVVEVFFLSSFLKWEDALYDNKDNYAN